MAFASSTPVAAIRGHEWPSGEVATPPTGMALYGKSIGGAALVTVTQGDAIV